MKSPRCSSPLTHYVAAVRAPTCAPLWPRVFMLMCLCVRDRERERQRERERERERERWLTPNEGESSQMMQWIVFTKRYFKTNEQTLSRSIFHKPASLLCFYVFSCSCWLSSLNEALYPSVGYRLQHTMSSRSLFYSVGFMFLLLLMKRTHCSAFPTAASATAVKAFLSLVNDLGPFLATNEYAIVFIRVVARGCFPKWIQTVWDSEWSVWKYPKGCAEQNPADTHCIAEIWNIHDAQCQRCQRKHLVLRKWSRRRLEGEMSSSSSSSM